MLTIALSKGRLTEDAIGLFEQCGIDCSELKKETRKLVIYSGCGNYRFIFVKPIDVPTYVERGVADIGIVGKDTLIEEEKDVYELLDLGFAKCRMCVCGYADAENVGNLVVATKYVNIAKNYYRSFGKSADIIKLNGSIELAPVIELADVIVDLVDTGKTLEANGLCVLNTLYEVSARFIVNKACLKIKRDEIIPLKEKIEVILKEGKND